MKQYTLINRVLAGVSFLITLITYMLTLQPSVPFWDCGEFTAAAAWQQVPHPPGAPLFLILAKWFHMVPIGDPGWRVNMFSATSSAFTAALVYLIVVKLIERWRPFRADRPLASYLPTFAAGIIATLSFTWSDTQWYNSVESEVYAAGTLLIALMMWVMMRWNEMAETPGHERYLLLMAYLVGLAFGIHLLALLVVPGIGMVIYFRRFRFDLKWFLAALALIAVVFYMVVYNFPLQYFPKLTANSSFAGILVIAGLLVLSVWARRNGKPIVSLASASMLMILLGFSTYAHILFRANSHPPMNENEPDTVSELVSYLGREQYGRAPNWPRRYQADPYFTSRQNRYGEWFPPVGMDEDGYIYDRINTSGELNFMFNYQIYHMYIRYLLWNFVGRASDVQNAPVTFASASQEVRQQFIAETGYDDVFPIQFFALPFILGLIGFYFHFRRDWRMALVYSALFLLLGVISTLQQNQQEPQPRERDYFYVGSYMIFAMWIGLGAAGLAQTLSARKKEDGTEDEESTEAPKTGVAGAVLAVCFLAVPINMVANGWKMHDRSKNWIPWDYSYNILQSLEKDAIVFTNGDNDTFPLWYLQDVAGVRRDVRVVNLSLGQTSWYIWQLKNERPWGAKTVPISFSNDILRLPENDRRSLRPTPMDQEQPNVTLDVPAAVMQWATKGQVSQPGKMSWTMRGGDNNYMGVQHKLVRDIITTNKWERPIYFSSSTQADVWSGLEPYFRSEGMAYRVMPVPQGSGDNRGFFPVNVEITRKCLLETLPADKWYTEPHYGFKFRNLADPDAYFNEDTRGTVRIAYRLQYMMLANHELFTEKNPQGAIAALDKLEKEISPDLFTMPYQFLENIANIYKQAGAQPQAAKYAQRALKALETINPAELGNTSPEVVKAQLYTMMGDYDRALQIYEALRQTAPNDPGLRAQIEMMQVERHIARKDTAAAVGELQKIIVGYGTDTSGMAAASTGAFRERLAELTGRRDNTQTSDSVPAAPPDRAR